MVLTVDVRRTPEDHRALLIAARRMIGPVRFAPFFVCMFVAFAAAVSGILVSSFVLHLERGLAALLTIAFVWATYPLGTRLGTKLFVDRLFNKSGAQLAPERISLDAQGLRSETVNTVYFVKWAGILKIDDQPKHVVVMVDKWVGLIIPKRSFMDAAAQAAFLDTLKSHVKEAS